MAEVTYFLGKEYNCYNMSPQLLYTQFTQRKERHRAKRAVRREQNRLISRTRG